MNRRDFLKGLATTVAISPLAMAALPKQEYYTVVLPHLGRSLPFTMRDGPYKHEINFHLENQLPVGTRVMVSGAPGNTRPS